MASAREEIQAIINGLGIEIETVFPELEGQGFDIWTLEHELLDYPISGKTDVECLHAFLKDLIVELGHLRYENSCLKETQERAIEDLNDPDAYLRRIAES